MNDLEDTAFFTPVIVSRQDILLSLYIFAFELIDVKIFRELREFILRPADRFQKRDVIPIPKCKTLDLPAGFHPRILTASNKVSDDHSSMNYPTFMPVLVIRKVSDRQPAETFSVNHGLDNLFPLFIRNFQEDV